MFKRVKEFSSQKALVKNNNSQCIIGVFFFSLIDIFKLLKEHYLFSIYLSYEYYAL